MSFANRLKQARQNAQTRDTFANKPDGWIGAVINGVNTILVPGNPNQVYVTLNKGDQRGGYRACINRSVSPVWNLPVMLGSNSQGFPVIVDIAESQIDAFTSGTMGGSSNSFRVPPHSHEYGMGLYDLVDNRRLVEGLVWWRGSDGAYVVYINRWPYTDSQGNGQEWPGGTFDLASYITVTTGQHQWIKIGLNLTTGLPTAIAGPAVSTTIPLLSSDLATLSFLDCMPGRGVQITSGQSIQGDSDFTDCSYVRVGSPVPLSGAMPPISALTLAAGAVTITQNYHAIVASSGTTDNLVTINGGVDRQFIVIQAQSGDTITVKNGTGNIFINSGSDFSLSSHKTLLLFHHDTVWTNLS